MPQHTASLRREGGQPWPRAVLAVKTAATLTLDLDPAVLVIAADGLHALSLAVATLDAWAAGHSITYVYLAHGQELGRGGALPARSVATPPAEGDEPEVEV